MAHFLKLYFCTVVRHKAKDLVDFIQDDDRLRDERKKAKKNKSKYTGISGMEMGGGSNRYSKYSFLDYL